ncbi:hypothetical protein HYE59_09660 [Aggregatibacter actinomycetemcomitans]|uniref:hypothetical protein n=1 Tax=Aggregatibacter actinomycetemcomitans TaxID=714 RepID=UPI00197C97D0|nr:hypothetical protein [Aggregatibacter actinomycetemcomitans]MBN6077791.1 hypothetical protein [Aggregatibacter actinomycetemcomitans]
MSKVISFNTLIPNFIPSKNIGINGLGIIYGNIQFAQGHCFISASIFMHNTSVKNNCVFIIKITVIDQNYTTLHENILKIDTSKSYMLASDQRFLGETYFHVPSAYKGKKLKIIMNVQCIYDSGSGLVTNWFPYKHTEEVIAE